MLVDIEDIIGFMDSYSEAFLDSNTYQCEYYQNVNLSDDYLGCIKLPEVDEISIIESYVQQLNIRKLKKVLETAKDDIDIIHKFHRMINDLNIYEEWCKYRHEYLKNIAVEWCKSNRILYKKQKK